MFCVIAPVDDPTLPEHIMQVHKAFPEVRKTEGKGTQIYLLGLKGKVRQFPLAIYDGYDYEIVLAWAQYHQTIDKIEVLDRQLKKYEDRGDPRANGTKKQVKEVKVEREKEMFAFKNKLRSYGLFNEVKDDL